MLQTYFSITPNSRKNLRNQLNRKIFDPLLYFCMFLSFHPQLVFSLPEIQSLSENTIQILQDGNRLTFNVGERDILDFESFNINAGESVIFNQPSSSSWTLSRIHDNSASSINGVLEANGGLLLLNPNGVIFGSEANLDIGSLVASTMELSDESFNSDNWHFSHTTSGKIQNAGKINAKQLIAFLGSDLQNKGDIKADQVFFCSATHIVMDREGRFTLEGELEKALLQNSGKINADHITFEALVVKSLSDTVINNTGRLEAESVAIDGDVIRLIAKDGGKIENTGTISTQSGQIYLKGSKINNQGMIEILDTGGSILLEGTESIHLENTSHLKAPGGTLTVTVDGTALEETHLSELLDETQANSEATDESTKISFDQNSQTVDETDLSPLTNRNIDFPTEIIPENSQGHEEMIFESQNLTDNDESSNFIHLSEMNQMETSQIFLHSDGSLHLGGYLNGNVDGSAQEIHVSHSTDVQGNLVLSAQNDIFLDKNLTIQGSIQSKDTTVHGGDSILTVGGNFDFSQGVFESENSTVNLITSKDSYILGNTTFNNLSIKATEKSVFFESGSSQIILGNFEVQGDFARYVKLLPSIPGQNWNIDPRGSRELSYTWVEGSYNLNPEEIFMTQSTNRDASFGWDPDATWTNGSANNLWSDVGNWDGLGGGATPGAGDNVFLDPTRAFGTNADITLDSVGVRINDFTLSGGYAGTFSFLNALDIDNDYNQNTGTVNLTQNLNIGGDFIISGGTFNHSTGTIFLDTSSTVVDIGATILQDVRISTGANIDITGTMNVDGTLSLGDVDSLLNGTLAASGDVMIDDGFGIALGGSGTILFDGINQTLSATGGSGWLPNVSINNTGTLSVQDTIWLRGDWTLLGGTVDMGTSTLRVDDTSTITSNGMTFNDVIVSVGNSTLILADDMDIDGNLTILGAASINGSDILASGNVISSDTLLIGSSTLIFDGNGNQLFSASGGSGQVPNVGINKSGGTLTVQDTLSTQDWNYVAGTVDFGTSTVEFHNDPNVTTGGLPFNNVIVNGGNTTMTLNGDVYVYGDFTLSSIASINNNQFRLYGNVTTTDNVVGGDSIFYFEGTANQILSASGGSGNLTHIIIDKTGGTLSMQDTISFSGDWFYNMGNINMGTSTIEFSGNSNITSGGVPFYNLSIGAGNNTLTLNDNIQVDNDFRISNLGFINGNVISVAGNVDINDGGGGIGGTTALTLDGSGNQTINANELLDGTLTINKASGSVTLLSDITLNGGGAQDLILTQGTLDLNGHNLIVPDTFTVGNNSTLELFGSEMLTASTINLNAGSMVTFTGDGDGMMDTYTVTNYFTIYENLRINSSDSQDVFNLGLDLTLNDDLALSNGIFDLNSFNLTGDVVNTSFSNDAVFRLQGGETITNLPMDTNSGTVLYNGTGAYLSGLAMGGNYYNLTFDGVGGLWRASTLTTINNNLCVLNGIFDSNGYTLTVLGNTCGIVPTTEETFTDSGEVGGISVANNVGATSFYTLDLNTLFSHFLYTQSDPIYGSTNDQNGKGDKQTLPFESMNTSSGAVDSSENYVYLAEGKIAFLPYQMDSSKISEQKIATFQRWIDFQIAQVLLDERQVRAYVDEQNWVEWQSQLKPGIEVRVQPFDRLEFKTNWDLKAIESYVDSGQGLHQWQKIQLETQTINRLLREGAIVKTGWDKYQHILDQKVLKQLYAKAMARS